jgi:hypothetical protein
MDKGLSIGGAGTKAFVIDKNLAGYNEMKTAVQARYESSTFYTTPEGTTNKIIIGD